MKILTRLENNNLKISKEDRERVLKKFKDFSLLWTEIKDYNKSRSLKQNKLYWQFINWVVANTPEWIADKFKFKLNKNIWHEILKAKMNITSTSFDSLKQEEFNKYFNEIVDYICMLFKIDNREDLLYYLDDYKIER